MRNNLKNTLQKNRLLRGSLELFRDLGRAEDADKFIKYEKEFDPQFRKEAKPFLHTLKFIRDNNDEYQMSITSGSRRNLIEDSLDE